MFAPAPDQAVSPEKATVTARPALLRPSLRAAWVRAIRLLLARPGYLLLALSVAFNLVALYPEASIRVPPLNDEVLHLANLQHTISALSTGQDPTDYWLPGIGMGYPLFHYYQHLPYMLPAAIGWLAPRLLPSALAPTPADLLAWTIYLALCLFPLSVYWSARRLSFGRAASGFAALASCLLSTNGLYGFDLNSYTWAGYGLYTQAWGMFFLFPAVAQGYYVLKHGRGYFLAVLLLAALLLSHLMMGYIGLVSLGLAAVVVAGCEVVSSEKGARLRAVWKHVGRLALLYGLGGLVTAYFFLPFVLDGTYMNRSVWELPGKYDAYGAGWTLSALFTGQLFDFGRFPSLTLLVLAGLGVCLWRGLRRQAAGEIYLLPAVLFVSWLLLYFGRPTWGALLNLLPMGGDLQLHRFIAGVHLGGILLIGIALGEGWRWALSLSLSRPARRNWCYLLVPTLLTILLLAPVYGERAAYLANDAGWMRQTQQATEQDRDLPALMNALRALPPGRVYAGLAGNWGSGYEVGAVPVYARLTAEGFDTLGYLYHALSLNGDLQTLFDESKQEQYDLFNVRYVVAPAGRTFPDFVKPIGEFGPNRLYQVTTSGYFDLVDVPAITLAGSKGDWYTAAEAWLQSRMPARKQHPAVSLGASPGPDGAVALSGAEAVLADLSPEEEVAQPVTGEILSQSFGAGRYGAEVEVQVEGTLMLKVSYHPNWHATVDGKETPTEMLMPAYVGVPLSPGHHEVSFEYRSQPYRAYLMVLGLLTLLGLGFVERRAKRRTASAGDPLAVRPTGDGTDAAHESGTPTQEVGAMLPGLTQPQTSEPLLEPLIQPQDAADVPAGAGYDTQEVPTPGERVSGPVAGFRMLLGLYLLFFGIYLASTQGHFWSTDHVSVYLTTQSLVERGDLAIRPVNDAAVLGPDGRFYSTYGPAQAVLSTPLYALGKFVDAIASPQVREYFGGAQLGEWGGTVPIFFVSLFNVLIMPLVCLLVFLFGLRLGFSRSAALLTTLAFGLGTGAWVAARDYFQHPLETLLLLSSVYVLFAHRERLLSRHALLSGALLGAGLLARANLLLLVPIVSIYLLYLLLKNREAIVPPVTERRWQTAAETLKGGAARSLLSFIVPLGVALALMLVLNYARYGNPLALHPTAQHVGFSLASLPAGLYGNLLSAGRSIFLYSPPAVLGLLAFRSFRAAWRAEMLLFVAIAATYMLAYSAYVFWEGGWSWGPRYLLPAVPFLVLPMGYLFQSASKWAIGAIGLVVVLGMGVQVLGVAVNTSYVYWDWLRTGLQPADAYLYVPAISPIATYLTDLLTGKNVDLWVFWVYQQFGWAALAPTLAAPLLIVLAGGSLLWTHLWTPRPVALLQRRPIGSESAGVPRTGGTPRQGIL